MTLYLPMTSLKSYKISVTIEKALAEATALEVDRINNYENKWKIQTSLNKFALLSISKSSPEPVVVNNNQIPFKREIKMLGLTLTRIKQVLNRI